MLCEGISYSIAAHTTSLTRFLRSLPSRKANNIHLSGSEYRESLRRYNPTVFVNSRRIESVVEEPLLAPGIAGVAVTYDFALREDLGPWMRATTPEGEIVNKMIAIPRDARNSGH